MRFRDFLQLAEGLWDSENLATRHDPAPSQGQQPASVKNRPGKDRRAGGSPGPGVGGGPMGGTPAQFMKKMKKS